MKGLLLIILLAALVVVFLFTTKSADKDNPDGTTQIQKAFKVIEQTEQLALDRTINNIKTALDNYYADNNEYPEMLDMLVPDYIPVPSHLDDPWGNRFKISQDEEMNLVLISAGPDRKFGSTDDIKRGI